MHQNTTNRPTAVGARHVKECARASPIPRDCNRTAACASSREAGRELGACTAGPTHPPLGLPASSPPVHRTVKNRYRERAGDAHASSHMQVQGGP